MIGPIAALLLLIPLAAPFGEATATATAVNDGLRLDVSVEVEGSPVAVLVRGVAPGEVELPPVALAERGDGRWEGIVELPILANILLGFESIPTRGPATVSELHTLTELGVDQAIFTLRQIPTGFGEEHSLVTPEGERWGWLGLAAGAAALTLVALWTIGTVRSRREQEDVAPDAAEADPLEPVDPIID